MHFLLGLLMILASSYAQAKINILHYNIKELDSVKIKNKVDQLTYVRKVVEQFSPDIISFNEVQYDLPNVPNDEFDSKGKNLKELGEFLDFKKLKNYSFYQANTGNNAKKVNGEYIYDMSNPQARDVADQVNFGSFPGQYSSGAIYKYKKLNTKVITKLKWKDFNPSVDISKFKQANGDDLPEDMELFDKNFTDVELLVEGRCVHLILLHTVPAFGFGNPHTPNLERNADQLRFLEWYLTGRTDIKVGKTKIKPLKKNSYFITVGDWNTDIKAKNPGSAVLNNMFKKVTPWLENPGITNQSSGFRPDAFSGTLDYIAVSKNLVIESAGIYYPKANRVELGCSKKPTSGSQDRVVVEYRSKDETCFAEVDRKYYEFKMASDHFPIFTTVKFKE